MRVLYVKTGESPKIVDVPHQLCSLQALVGGRIEVVEPFDDDAILVCNEEGRNIGLPVNRIINESMDICGDFFLCCFNGNSLSDITQELAARYTVLFS